MRYKSTSGLNSIAVSVILFFLFLSQLTKAQDILTGLTSNGGTEGRGTAFSIKTNGTSFSIIKAFADWGKNPWGDLLNGGDSFYYGTSSVGGTNNSGSIFKATATGVVTVLRQLVYATDGANPYGELIKGSDGNFYGLTSSGGSTSHGTIFKITPAGVFTVIRHLSSADGSGPRGHLVIGADGNFYGATYTGGANGYGTIFKMTPTGSTFTVLRSLSSATDGANCYGSLVKGSDNNFYGTTNGGGTFGQGTIFKITPAGVFTVLRHMNNADGVHSQSDLIQATDGNFYGMAYSGGANFGGTVFKITSGGTFTVLRNFSATTDGQGPYGSLLQGTDGNFYGMTSSGGANSGGTIFKITAAGALTVLHALQTTTDGSSPRGSLVTGTDGNYYGLTNIGGSNLSGTLFKITPAGVFTVLSQFNGATQGNAPYETLLKGKDSAYYGTTSSGGVYNYGTIFKICGGAVSILHSFNRTVDGGTPKGSLIQGTDNNFYGTASDGGTSGSGTIFKITQAGVFTVLKNLSSAVDGSIPQGSLLQATDGNFYGMNSSGGTGGVGTIFKITSAGVYTVLRHLVGATDGSNPQGNLVQGTDGNLYGMTYSNGRVFKITTAGVFTVLHTLVSATEGSYPSGSLVLGTTGLFYGTTSGGGTNNAGTIFKVTTTGTLTVMRQLTAATDGSVPKGNLIQAVDGNFYGTASTGGTYGVGTIFKITAAGTYTVLRHFNMATDGGNAYGSLIIAPVNNLVANPQSATTAEDVSKKITLTGSGGSPLTFTVALKPKHGKVTGTGAIKTYKPNANYNGADSFTFTVSVNCFTSAPAKVKITVTPVADTPVLAPVGNKSVVKNTLLTFTATATDADAGQTRSFSLIGAPAGAAIGATTGVFTWTPAATGNFTFKVRVTDNGVPALFDEEQITVTVTASFAMNAAINNEALTIKPVEATIYPNPVTNKLIVTLSTHTGKVSATVTDIRGTVLITSELAVTGKDRLEIDVTQLKSGHYFLKLQTRDGYKTLKFIKR
ncbi:hypothetical protein BH10BAC2_BH10BAC2_05760 [soil metagenome]